MHAPPEPEPPRDRSAAVDPAPDDLATRARRGALWTGSTAVVWQACSWVLTLFTARILEPEDYGILAMSQVLAPFLSLVASLNLGTWIVQAQRFGAREQSALYGLTTALGLAMTLVGLAIAPLLGRFFADDDVVRPFQLLSLTLVFQGSSAVPLAILRRELNLKPIAVMNVTAGVTSGVLQLVLALAGFGYWALISGLVFRALATAAWAHLAVGLPRRVTWDREINRQAFAFGVPATLALLTAIAYNSSDNVIVGKLFSVEFLGFYSMAFFLSDLPLARINEALHPVFFPYFARLRSSPERLADHFALYTLSVASVTFPVLLGLAAVAPELIAVVLGEKWLPMVTPLRVLCIAGLARAFVDSVPHLLLALGRPVQVFRVRLVYLACMPAGFLAGALAMGVNGIYLVWLFIFPAISVGVLLVLRRETGIGTRAYSANLLPPLACSSAMAATTWLATELLRSQVSAPVLLGLQIASGIACYSGMYLVFFRGRAQRLLGVLLRSDRDA